MVESLPPSPWVDPRARTVSAPHAVVARPAPAPPAALVDGPRVRAGVALAVAWVPTVLAVCAVVALFFSEPRELRVDPKDAGWLLVFYGPAIVMPFLAYAFVFRKAGPSPAAPVVGASTGALASAFAAFLLVAQAGQAIDRVVPDQQTAFGLAVAAIAAGLAAGIFAAFAVVRSGAVAPFLLGVPAGLIALWSVDILLFHYGRQSGRFLAGFGQAIALSYTPLFVTGNSLFSGAIIAMRGKNRLMPFLAATAGTLGIIIVVAGFRLILDLEGWAAKAAEANKPSPGLVVPAMLAALFVMAALARRRAR